MVRLILKALRYCFLVHNWCIQASAVNPIMSVIFAVEIIFVAGKPAI
jgi:hypothetical protein